MKNWPGQFFIPTIPMVFIIIISQSPGIRSDVEGLISQTRIFLYNGIRQFEGRAKSWRVFKCLEEVEMEKSTLVENFITLRNFRFLFIYTIILGVIGIGFVFITIVTIIIGTTELAAAPLVLALSFVPALILSAPFLGALYRKKWGRIVNILLLSIVVPPFMILPGATLWMLPHSEMYFPVELICVGAVLLGGLDFSCLLWFIGNKETFT